MTVNIDADHTSHHIEGYARAALERGQAGHFRCPLISHIVGNLYVGGCIDGVRLPDDFRHVVSLYKWERYALGPTTTRHEFTMYDAGDMPDLDQLDAIVRLARDCVRGGKTLIHCQAGLNRSNLVASLVLIGDGMPAAEAVALLREKRSPVVLCNETFERYVLAQGDQ